MQNIMMRFRKGHVQSLTFIGEQNKYSNIQVWSVSENNNMCSHRKLCDKVKLFERVWKLQIVSYSVYLMDHISLSGRGDNNDNKAT